MKEVIDKLKFKNSGVIINAPVKIEKEFVNLGFINEFDKYVKSNSTIIFVNNNNELMDILTIQLKNIEN